MYKQWCVSVRKRSPRRSNDYTWNRQSQDWLYL